MNQAQIKTLSYMTDRIATLEAGMVFGITVHNDDIIFSAVNMGCDWFMPSVYIGARIGVRGGIHWYDASAYIRRMVK